MKVSKERKEALQIINFVLDRGAVTASIIADSVGVSEKTIRKRISYANDILKENDAGVLVARPGMGIALSGDIEQRERALDLVTDQKREEFSGNKDRMVEILRVILGSIHRDSITLNQVADKIYTSAPTVAKEIKECKKWLKGFNIHLSTVQNKGIEINFQELDYRQAMKEFICKLCDPAQINQEMKGFFPEIDVEMIRESLIWVENEWNFHLTDTSFSEIFTYICIATFENYRHMHELIVDIDNEEIKHYNEFNFAEKVYSQVNRHLGLVNRDNEIFYLTIQILCSQVISSANTDPVSMMQKYDQKLREFVSKTILVVSGVLNIDLTGDERLHTGLLHHIRALIFRLKYGQALDTTVQPYIRKNFITTLRVTWLVSTLFEEYFHLSIGDDELSYIALYIQSAIDCSQRPVDAVLVSDQNMSITRLIHDRLLHTSKDIARIDDVSVHQFLQHRYRDAELVLSLTPLDIDDDRVLVLKDPFEENNADRIHDKIITLKEHKRSHQRHFDSICHQLFEPDLMMAHAHYTDKNELLFDMCKLLENKGYVSHNYYPSVIKRENVANTAIGGCVAIPHGDMTYTNESKIVVATLDEPIAWGDEKVDVVFLLNVLMKSEAEVYKWQAFYKQFIQLTDSKEELTNMKYFDDPVDLFCYLIQ